MGSITYRAHSCWFYFDTIVIVVSNMILTFVINKKANEMNSMLFFFLN